MNRISESDCVEVSLDGIDRKLRTLPSIKGSAFQHPDDIKACAALEAVPIFPQIVSFLRSNYNDQMARMQHLLYNLRLGPDQGAELYAKFVLASRILNLKRLPELYLSGDINVNAFASGVGRPIIVLNRGLLSNLTEAETLAIIGHELGHIKCNHMLNRWLADIFGMQGISVLAAVFPLVGAAAQLALKAALSHWSRMAEYSCDRAALLVVQDANVVGSALAKLSGLISTLVPDFNFEGVFRQIEDYERFDQNTILAVAKFQETLRSSLYMSHPYTSMRIKKIFEWSKSDQYEDIVNGVYEKESHTSERMLNSDAVICSNCGQYSSSDSSFCSNCGNEF